MNAEEYDRMYHLEDSYWWFVGRHHLVETFIQAEYPGRTDLTILDIGCGTGAMSKKLEKYGHLTGKTCRTLLLILDNILE